MCKLASLIFTEARKKLGKELQDKKSRTHELCHKQARREGGNGGNCPPNSGSSTSNFQINQPFDV